MLEVWSRRVHLCALFVIVACIFSVAGATAVGEASTISQATASHESASVRRELANISKRTSPFVGPAPSAGAKWTLPKGARLIEADTTADSDTYALPNGH